MKTSDMIRQLYDQLNISVSELARRLGQSPQNFGNRYYSGCIFCDAEVKSYNHIQHYNNICSDCHGIKNTLIKTGIFKLKTKEQS